MKLKGNHLAIMIIMLVIVPVATASNFIYSQESLVLDLDISTHLSLTPKSSDARIKSLKVNLSYFPRDDDSQTLISFKAEPKYKKKGDALIFDISPSLPYDQDISEKSRVKVKNHFIPIKKIIKFPTTYPFELKDYTKSNKIIDINQDITNKASEIVQGENDLVRVIYKLATWVRNNVKYTLDSYTADVSKEASWVLQNKQGVCDEITSLFIAMCRSLGIPARYVSGVAYTNYNQVNDWGPHAWAEVYFPDFGWVPFDVTYGEFGFIDASHVALSKSFDAGNSNINYEWIGYNADLKASKLSIKTNIVEKSKTLPKLTELNLKAYKEKTGFGSYNLIELNIANKMDYYVIATVQAAKTKQLEILDDLVRVIVLKPKEIKKVFWLVKINKSLEHDYLYTLPFYVETLRNSSAEINFTASDRFPLYGRAEFEKIKDSYNSVVELKSGLEIKCATEKDFYYIYQNVTIKCDLRNTGNNLIKDLSVCLENNCKSLDLGINQEKTVDFNIKPKSRGEKSYIIKAKASGVSSIAEVKTKVYDAPKIKMVEVKAPKEVKYEDQFIIEFKLQKISYSTPKNIAITYFLKDQKVSEVYAIELNNDQTYKLKVKGSDLKSEKNIIKVNISYEDDNKKHYGLEKDFVINLKNLTFMQKLLLFLNNINTYLESIFS